jgi:hypothetical protein
MTMLNALSPIHTAARVYAMVGWSVIPLRPGQKVPDANILPGFSWEQFKTRRASLYQIGQWFASRPAENIGVVTGAVSGFFVLDCDTHEAVEHVEALGIPNTLVSHTSGGMHYLFRMPDFPVGNRANLLKGRPAGVDIRGNGGYIVAPPSVHPSGHQYRWSEPGLDILPAPQWLLDLLAPPPQPVSNPRPTPTPGTGYASAALEAERRALMSAGLGYRNDQLNRSAFNLGQLVAEGRLAESEVRIMLFETALLIGLPEIEAARTIRSGLTAGIAKPRTNRAKVRA